MKVTPDCRVAQGYLACSTLDKYFACAVKFIAFCQVLQKIKGPACAPNIILFKSSCLLQVIRNEGLIYMVLEYGDIDLARLLAKHEKAQRDGGVTDLDENFIRLYWQQMLQVLEVNNLNESYTLCVEFSRSMDA